MKLRKLHFLSFLFFCFFFSVRGGGKGGVTYHESDVVKKLYKKFVDVLLLASFHQRMSSMELVLRKQSLHEKTIVL